MVVLSKLTLMITLHALAWDEIKVIFIGKKVVVASSVSMEITQHNKEEGSSSSSSSSS